LGHFQSKFLATPVLLVNNLMVFKKRGLGRGLTGLDLEKIGGLVLVT